MAMTPKAGGCSDGHPLEGRYANYFKVGHNALEFVIDFGQIYHGRGKAQTHTRIVTNPAYAKAMLETLHQAIQEYEQAFGTISAHDG